MLKNIIRSQKLWISVFTLILFTGGILTFILVRQFTSATTQDSTNSFFLQEQQFVITKMSDNYRPYLPLEFKVRSFSTNPQFFKVSFFKKDNSTLTDIFGQDEWIYSSSQDNQLPYYLDFSYRDDVTLQFSLLDTNENVISSTNFHVYLYSNMTRIPQKEVFLGLEMNDLLSSRKILTIDRKEGASDVLGEWFSFLGVDTVVYPLTVSYYDASNTNTIWYQEKLEESQKLAQNNAKLGIKNAVWINPLEIDSFDYTNYPYQFSMSEKELSSVISIEDKKRQKDLIQLLRKQEEKEYINYIGFKKIFFPNNFEELQTTFSNIPVDNTQKNDLNFQNWRKFQMVSYWKEITDSLEHQKEIFTIFSGQQIMDFPEYVSMAMAAGVDFVFINLETSIPNFEQQWDLIQRSNILKPFEDRIIYSYCLNYNNVFDGDGSAINNWITQNLRIGNRIKNHSLYVNDFYKALFGNRGPYPAYEWMAAIGDLISQWKNKFTKEELAYKVKSSDGINEDQINLHIQLSNQSSQALTNVTVHYLPLSSMENTSLFEIKNLAQDQSFQTNLILTNIQFEQKLFKKKSFYLGFHFDFESDEKNVSQVKLISFDDPEVPQDRKFASEDALNRRIAKIIAEKERQEELQRLELARLKALEERKKIISRNSNQSKDILSNKLNDDEKGAVEPEKKLTWLERMRLAREERARKRAERRAEREAKKKAEKAKK